MDAPRLINEYLDGRLSPAQRERFEAALAADAALAAECRAMQRTLALVRSLPVEPVPANLTARIMSQVQAAPVPLRRHGGGWLSWLVRPRQLVFSAAVAAALVAVLGLYQAPTASPVRLSRADEQFVGECLVDYHLAVSDRLRHASQKAPAQHDGTGEF